MFNSAPSPEDYLVGVASNTSISIFIQLKIIDKKVCLFRGRLNLAD